MAEALRRRGWAVNVLELSDSFPFPTAAALQQAARALSHVERNRLVVVDGLAFGAMPEVVAEYSSRLQLMAVVHLPLAATIGFNPDVATRLAESERLALAHARRVVITGRSTRSLMTECGLVHNDVVVVEPGTDPAALAIGSGSTDVHLLTVATLNPGKGHETLIEALALVPHRRWRLTCVGSLTRHPETSDEVRYTIARLGLGAHVTLVGELSVADVGVSYHRADVMVLASRRETYGMAVAEALARGLPVVATATGAIPDLVGNEAGIVVAPGHRRALAAALTRMIDDAVFRARCAAGARRVRERLPDWGQAAARMETALAL